MSNFIQQAYKGKIEWWRYLFSILFVFIGWQVIGFIPFFVLAIVKAGNVNNWLETLQNVLLGVGVNSNLYLFLMILSFLIGLISLFFAVKYIHDRKITSLITSRKNVDWNRVKFSFLLWFVISLIVIIIDFWMNSDHYVWNFRPIPFIILVLISFVLIPFQTSFEEILFRGYFMQGLGVLFKNMTFPLIITSLIFGMSHGLNPEVEKLGQVVLIYYVATGFLFGITTLMDDGLELSIGMHAANNIAAAVFVTMDWSVFQTEALFVDTSEPQLEMELFFPILVIYPFVLFVFSKKYKWENWKEKLFAEIEMPHEKNEMAN